MEQRLLLLPLVVITNAVIAQSCLVAYYPFTGNAADATGNGNDGIVMGATLDQDRFGNANAAYRFDGVDDLIDIGNGPELLRANTDFTVSAWIAVDAWSAVRATIITNRDGAIDTSGTHIGVAGLNDTGPGYDEGELNITCVTPNNLCADTAITLQVWHHVALTYDRTNAWVTFYYNGQPVGDGPLPNFLEKAHVHHTLGYASNEGGGVYPLNGRLDEVALFNCALSDAEVLDVFIGSLTVSIGDHGSMQVPALFPNPATDELVLPATYTADLQTIRLLDLSGRAIPVSIHEGRIDVRTLPSGTYVLYVISDAGHYHARFQRH